MSETVKSGLYPVVIVGGGPVGLTLSLTLAHFGIRSVLLERNPTTTSHPKMDITNGRSMELFQRVGALDVMRSVATAPDAPFDVSWITTLNGHELARFIYPGSAGFEARIKGNNDGSQPHLAPIRASQIMVEPALKALADRHPLIDVRFAVRCEDFTKTDEGFVINVRRAHDGKTEAVRGQFLVGCDGGSSVVRGHLGIGLSGQSRLPERFITHFRSNARHLLQRWGPSWHYQSSLGTLVAQNDWDTWTLLSRLPEGMTAAQANPSDLLATFAGEPFDHSVMVCNAWSPNLLVADSYGAGRAFIAGDAAHQYIPTGGYGMNTGIGDAVDIGWKLAATLHGFGGPGLVASYDAERRPVGARNLAGSGRHNATRIEIASLYAGRDLGGAGSGPAREEVGARIAAIGNAENESYGIELGYWYADSPIVCHEPGVEAPQDPLRYEPTTVSGVRLPTAILEDGVGLYDRLGQWFTLIHYGDPVAQAFADAAREMNLPLSLLDLQGSPLARQIHGGRTLLVRPDTHIAWRGMPGDEADAAKVLRTAAGW
ncbi:FAD-dependent monooxygenase [Novosphingobium colocasiae]|uniref:FAD-binding domain-containing protein n=1 Tax=Novosphingobium colocasiae TaxID=1256513 RepID=A0A918UH63_9SPHN|nr:FAD-dependent monooxygenase [Novosphingobium colocasiae]GGZ11199.1 hypothetical protein GCM10011614_27680 [Novosphingobium colocasiae]